MEREAIIQQQRKLVCFEMVFSAPLPFASTKGRTLMLKRYSFSLIPFLCLCIAALAVSTVQATESKPLMWKVKHRYATLYIAGSIHALNEDYYPLADAYRTAFDSSHKLVIELNIDAIDPNYMRSILRQKTWLPTDTTLEKYLSEADLALLKKYSHEMTTPYNSLIRMRPWMVMETLTMLQLRQANFDPQKGVDRYFMNLAKKKSIPILELESVEEQISALADAPFQSQLAALSLSLQQLEDTTYLSTLADLWQQGDENALYQFVYADIENNQAIKPMMEMLLDDRNKKMTDVLGIYLATRHTYFVVVGALHLSGPNSIIKLLEKKGYNIEKMH